MGEWWPCVPLSSVQNRNSLTLRDTYTIQILFSNSKPCKVACMTLFRPNDVVVDTTPREVRDNPDIRLKRPHTGQGGVVFRGGVGAIRPVLSI